MSGGKACGSQIAVIHQKSCSGSEWGNGEGLRRQGLMRELQGRLDGRSSGSEVERRRLREETLCNGCGGEIGDGRDVSQWRRRSKADGGGVEGGLGTMDGKTLGETGERRGASKCGES